MRIGGRTSLTIIIGAAIVLAACGGGTDDASTVAESTTTTIVATATEASTTTTTTTIVETTTTSPYVVFKRAGENGVEPSQLATASDAAPVALYATVSPNRSGTLATIEWEGSYTDCGPGGLASAFTIRIHPDGGGQPDLTSTLFEAEVPLDATGETLLVETSNPDCETSGDLPLWQFPFYSYVVNVADGPALAEGEPIWILVQAQLPDFSTTWGWRTSGLGRPPSKSLFNGAWTDASLGASTVGLTVLAD